MTTFCWCGRVDPCKKHHGLPVPEKRKKIGKYSGFSKFRAKHQMFQNYQDPKEERWPDEEA
jgi:hypothetical protein